jgi:prepilin-type N-terminal cleavage/methylation domain-containing protein
MRENRKALRTQRSRDHGFTLLELIIVIAISLVVAAFSVPAYTTITRNLRIAGDGRSLNGTINEAKLQAASDFSRSRVFADLTANTFHNEIWNKTGNGGAGCWQTVNDPTRPCTVLGTSPTQNLSQGVTFGFGTVGTAPTNTQTVIGQSALCGNINGGTGTIGSSACIVFNSRGIPIIPATGAPAGNNAFYITDNTTVYGVTTNATGYSQVWARSASSQTSSWYHK